MVAAAAARSRSRRRYWREADSESFGFSSAEGLGCSVARGGHTGEQDRRRGRERERVSESGEIKKGPSAEDDRPRESAVSKSVIVFIQKITTSLSVAPVDVSSS